MKKIILSALLVFTSAIAAMANGHTVGIQTYNNIQCFGMTNGSATVTVSGGIGPFTYSWAPNGGTDATATGLSADTYTITVTDQNDLSTETAAVTITSPASLLTASASASPSTLCYGSVTTLNCNASGGVPAYNYQWGPGTDVSSNFICGPTASPTTSKTYTLTVTDMNGCIATTAVAITVNGTGTGITGSTVICNGSSTTLTASGTGAYSWNTGETTATITVAPSSNTTYTVAVTDGGCTFTATAGVTVNLTSPTINVPNATICPGYGTTLTASGATTYSWSPITGLGNTTGTSVFAYPKTTTTYTVVGTMGACIDSTTVVVTVKPAAIVSYTPYMNICNGSSATLSVSGGAPVFTWVPGTGLSATTGTSVTANPVVSTTYTVTGTLGGCVANYNVQVGVFPIPNPAISGSTTICSGENTTLTAITNNIYGLANYEWNTGATSESLTVAPLNTTSYTVVATSYGCSGSAGVTVTIAGPALTGITVTDSIYKETCLDTGDGAIDVTLSGSNPGPFTYQWNNGASTQDIINLSSNNYNLIIFDPSMNCFSKVYTVISDGSNCGSISGNVFYDKDLDCIKNNNDINLPNIMVITNPGNYKAFSNSQGNYVFNSIPYGTYSLTQQSSNPNVFPTCVNAQNVILDLSSKNVTNLSFVDTTKGYKDVAVDTYLSHIVPGFSSYANLYFKNLTGVPASGTLSLILPLGISAFITSAYPYGYSILGDTIRWTYSNLSSNFSCTVNFTVPVNTSLGSVYTSCANATVIGGDQNPVDNDACYMQIVTGSFDPNDKSVNPIGQGPQGNITTNDKTLNYHINFQNTGNGPAVNIVVKDTLSDKLDINSLEVTGSSHNYIMDVLPGNVLRWKFNNIMLVDSGSNQADSHGWISYRIKQKTSNQIGDVIKNTAYIYFDFNSAVVTNTTINTIAAPTGVEEIANSNSIVKVYPNPFTDNTTFLIQSNKLNEKYSFELVDVLGKQVRSIKEITTKEFQISRNGLENGIYFYKIYNAESIVGIGKLIVR